MRLLYGILALLWGGIFVAFLYGYEPSGFLVGSLLVLITLHCLFEALSEGSTEIKSFELSEATVTVSGKTSYIADVKKSDGITKTFHGDTAEEARSKAMKYIEKESK